MSQSPHRMARHCGNISACSIDKGAVSQGKKGTEPYPCTQLAIDESRLPAPPLRQKNRVAARSGAVSLQTWGVDKGDVSQNRGVHHSTLELRQEVVTELPVRNAPHEKRVRHFLGAARHSVSSGRTFKKGSGSTVDITIDGSREFFMETRDGEMPSPEPRTCNILRWRSFHLLQAMKGLIHLHRESVSRHHALVLTMGHSNESSKRESRRNMTTGENYGINKAGGW